MRFIKYKSGGRTGLAVQDDHVAHGYFDNDAASTASLETLLIQGTDALKRAAEVLRGGRSVDLSTIEYLPPLTEGKVICVGLNYRAHVEEAGAQLPNKPTIFARFKSSLVGCNRPLVLPHVSSQLDWEGELVAVIGKRGRYISKHRALDHVAGYSVFNDGTLRDYQFETTQWTLGKNFDGTGGFGPAFVTADEVPAGASGLSIQTRLNDEVMQDSTTADMIFDVATLVSYLSEGFTLEPGDVIVTGTPRGVGWGRDPKIFMKVGDVCEVEIEGIGLLRNTVVAEQ